MTVAEKILRAKADYGEVHEAGKNVGYGTGYSDGKQSGYTEGYNKCTEDMQDDLQAKYDEGYENGNQVGVAIGIEQGIEQGKEIGYAEGYAAGKAEAGGGSDTYGVEEMLTTLPFLRKAEWITTANNVDDYYENWEHNNCGYGGLIVYYFTDIYQSPLVIVPPWITEIQDDTIGSIIYDPNGHGMNLACAIFTSKTPPVVSWIGMWSSDGGNYPPAAIFVPDESIEAYKATTNLVEFAHLIKPLSEYNGEGYYGGKL